MAKKCIIRGDSMWPFLRNGDVITPIEVENLKIGDIVIFTTEDNMKVFHRVVLLDKNEIKCKGDNCLHFDWIKYNFGSTYRVIRHRFQYSAAKLSRYWGNHYNYRYNKNPSKYQSKNVYVKIITILQRFTLLCLYVIYRMCIRRDANE